MATVTLRLAMRHGDHKKMRFMFQSRWTCAKALRGWGESDKRQELKAGWCGWRPVSERERESGGKGGWRGGKEGSGDQG